MFKIPVYFISDNHFKIVVDESESNRREKLFHVFEKIKKTGGTLVIGGDFFDFWFDYRFVIPSGYIDILYQLKQLSQLGITIHYILGNHDYWDFGFFNNEFDAQVYPSDLEFYDNKSKILVSHGDGLLKNDYNYRLMRKIIRNRFCIFLFKNFHPDWGCALAKKVAKVSQEYNHHNQRSKEIRDELIEYARSQWQMGISTILLGHYHQIGIIEEKGNYVIFMGDWIKHFTVTRLDENGWWQGNWKEI